MRTAIWVILAATACGGVDESAGTGAVAGLEGGTPEVVISSADGLIGGISDLVLDTDGTLYAVDRQSSRVYVIGPSGQVRTLGRPGAGPGEFSQPTTLEPRGDTLLVVDWGNGRLQGISRLGEALFTLPIPPGQAPSIGAGGRFVRPTWGVDTMLAVLRSADLSVVAPLGRIVGAPTNQVNPGRMKEEIRHGRVPDIFLNTAQALLAPDSSTWLYVPARGSVQRFDADGRELFQVELEERDNVEIFNRFVEENAEKPSGSFALLRYIADATVVDGNLWVLLGNSPTGAAAVRVIHPDGELGERIEFPQVTGASQLAVDATRGVSYFVRRDFAELVRVPLGKPAG